MPYLKVETKVGDSVIFGRQRNDRLFTRRMATKPPLHRFEEYGALSATEHQAVLALADKPIIFSKGRAISREGEVAAGFYILFSGWATASHVLPNGSRQIMKIHLPGDALGTPSMAMKHATEDLVALTDVAVGKVPFARFGPLFETHPRIAARFMLSIQQERIALMDRLASMGRTSATARVASFIIDLAERLEPLDLLKQNRFEMVPTQEQIGDLLGLTAVHVNRVLSFLTKQKVVERSERQFHIVDEVRLAELASRPIRVRNPDQTWLPDAR